MAGMRILCVDLTGELGHLTFNGLIMDCLASLGDLTLAATPDYLAHCDLPGSAVPLPSGPPEPETSLLRHRLNQVRRWRAARPLLLDDNFEARLLLGYEPVTASLMCPRVHDLWSIEHNTIEQASRSLVKGFCFRHLPAGWRHFVFLDEILEHLEERLGRRGAVLPLPLQPRPTSSPPPPPGFPTGRRVIFAPSRSNQPSLQGRLAEVFRGRQDLVLATRGDQDASGDGLLFRRQFDDYAAWLEHAHTVFFSGDFAQRVSGVVYDALGSGTPAILMPCAFGKALAARYPQAVKIASRPEEVPLITFDAAGVAADCRRLRQEHAREQIIAVLSRHLLPALVGRPEHQ